MMTLSFLGTGAAEGVPPIFGRNAYFANVRRRGGPDIRTRSSLRLGSRHQIDFTPDAFSQMISAGLDTYDLEHLLITHTDHDHFQIEGIVSKEMPRDTNGKPLHLYLSPPAARWLDRALPVLLPAFGESSEGRRAFEAAYPVHVIDYFSETAVGGLHVSTLKGNHKGLEADEWSLNYLITEPDGARLLYASDTGYYSEETWEYLENAALDLLVMECTFGGRRDREPYPFGHLHCESFVHMLERMQRIGAVHERTAVYATHINPDQGLDHQGLQSWFQNSPFPKVRIAYDGLQLNFGR
jgi:phosphoribosyl 1,2-cyclic phosphate phosphodiesterase